MKLKLILPVVALMLSATTLTVHAAKNDQLKEKFAAMTEEQKQARVEEINERVTEIKEMDKSELTSEDRQELRSELKDLKKEAKAANGVYLSLGAIIIIILLLILIL
jgi:Flp pilus assembly protein TadB